MTEKFTPEYLLEKKYVYRKVYIRMSIITQNWKLLHQQVNWQTVVYWFSGKLLNNSKNWITDTHNNMDESEKYYAKR